MRPEIAESLKKLPAMDELLRHCEPLHNHYGRELLSLELKSQLTQARLAIIDGKLQPENRDSIIEMISVKTSQMLSAAFEPSLRSVFNLTGVVLHTNLGRAPYPQNAIDAIVAISRGACNLEYDLKTGQRGRRDDHVEKWICTLTGAEAATTVNNNAAAVLLVLNTLAKKKEVLVSRGELIEIGGSFRMPTIMKKSGCKLREVGTTNRTHLRDYESAIGKRTAAMMKVHTSNYEIEGFKNSVTATQLATLSKKAGLPLIDDMGSGSLVDLTSFGLPYERTAREALAEGVDVITFSGDKLLGGPQCGIIAGKKTIIEQIERNPMKRALRLDKLTLAALESVLKLYTNPERLCTEVPSLMMLTRPLEKLRDTAGKIKAALSLQFASQIECGVEECHSQIGSGALPTKTLPSIAVTLRPIHQSIESLAGQLRELPRPVIGRIQNDSIVLDVRTLEDENALLHEFTGLARKLT